MHKLILFAALMVVICPFTRSQSSISDVQFTRVPGDNSSITTPLDSVFNVECIIVLTDSVNIAKIHLIRSLDHSATNVINTDTLFFLDQIINPDINRSGLQITWNAGTQTIMQRYYYTVRLEDLMGNIISSYIKQ